ETGVPEDPANAPVWREIADYVDQEGFDGTHVSVANAPRDSFAAHPWAIGGGGAAELKEQIDETCEKTLKTVAQEIGVLCITGEDDVFVRTQSAFSRADIHEIRPFAFGEELRDWSIEASHYCLYPYASDNQAYLSKRTGIMRPYLIRTN